MVPLGKRKAVGFFIEKTDAAPPSGLKSIVDIIDKQPLFSKELYSFLLWMADYYLAGIGDVLQAALPPEMRKVKHSESSAAVQSGILKGFSIDTSKIDDEAVSDAFSSLNTECTSKKDIIACGLTDYRFRKLLKNNAIQPVYGLPDILPYIKSRPEILSHKPTNEQNKAIKEITHNSGKFHPILLYGITGSGKTLVYCHATKEVLRQGKTVLVLVPEIALAGTLLASFRAFFGDTVALMHSALKAKERHLIWQNIQNGTYRIVIGARSGIFAPLENPGLIIVDEEHDESFKQDDPSPRFQARDAAVMRARMAKIPIVLGSATPSLESFYNAQTGRYNLITLTRRPEKAETPIVRLVDLSRERVTPDNLFFTKTMSAHIKKSIKSKQQVILYLNRRGFSPRIKCTNCGDSPICPHCMVTLTYHRSGNKLMCHLCGHTTFKADKCEKCKTGEFVYIGTGTQKVEDKIGELFESARMVRLDSDSARGRERSHKILNDFSAHKYDILLGTQMVTKGIDFPDVSLVGVLMADIGLDMPDFRASEKLFARLIQVAGRSGRGIVPGEVVVQTFNPKLDLIDDAARQDYDTFYKREIESREMFKYPPFSHLVNFRLSSKKETPLEKNALLFKNYLEERIKNASVSAIVLGPAPCPLYRVRGQYRRNVVVKTKQIVKFVHMLSNWDNAERNFGIPSSIRIIPDIDPYDMM